MILFHSDNSIKFSLAGKRQVKSWLKEIAALHHKQLGDINYIFCADSRIIAINQEFLNHDYYTDIISFDYSKGKLLSGDIFISIETVRSNSVKYNTSFNEELHRVIVHGVLHFVGFKDKNKADAEKMRLAENHALQILANKQ